MQLDTLILKLSSQKFCFSKIIWDPVFLVGATLVVALPERMVAFLGMGTRKGCPYWIPGQARNDKIMYWPELLRLMKYKISAPIHSNLQPPTSP